MQQVLIARLPQPEMILTGGKREVQPLSFSSFPDWHRPAPESQRWAQPYVGVVHCYRGISVLPYHLRWLCGLHGGAIQKVSPLITDVNTAPLGRVSSFNASNRSVPPLFGKMGSSHSTAAFVAASLGASCACSACLC